MTASRVTDRVSTHQNRIERLRAALAEHHLDAILITNPENRRYLSGFTGHDSGTDSAGTLVVAATDVALITDGRYIEQATTECPGLRIVKREGSSAPVIADALTTLGAHRVGFEAAHATVAVIEDITRALAVPAQGNAAPDGDRRAGIELVATRSVIEPLRAVKDADEQSAIERAAAITDETFTHLCGYLKPGITERQAVLEIERYMRERGAEGLAFDPMVASGPNASQPHAAPTDRALALGEPIIIDMGARYGGYCADMTRTVCLGEPGPEGQAIYDAVLHALDICERGLHPGISGQDADALARAALESAGYGAQFLHGTGHGLGLEIHENPRLSKVGADQMLAPGMAVTVEPGVYVAGWGGVRIEDTVILTDEGIRVLTHSHKQFVLPR